MTDLGGCSHGALAALVQAHGERPVRITVLTSLPSPTIAHASYRLDFAGRQALKGRQVESRDQVNRMAAILPCLDSPSFPVVLAHRDNAVLEPWVEGQPLGNTSVAPALLARCGTILGRVHAVACGKRVRWRTPDAYLDDLERDLFTFALQGRLTRRIAVSALHTATASAPPRFTVGFTHGDYCGDNLVLSTRGHPVSIDNETVSVGAHDHDLARTWYRWPMGRSQFGCFLRGYEEHRSAYDFVAHFPFWAVVALTRSAAFRIRAHTAGEHIPLHRLMQLLRTMRRSRWSPGSGLPTA